MKNIFPILLLIISTGLFAQQANHDATFIEIHQDFTLNEDGSQVYHFYKKLELNTHYSFNRLYGETFIVYNPKFQELTINESKTTHKNGKVTEGPFNSFNEVLPGFASNAPYYNHLREMVVTHPGTEIGAVIELDYTLKTKSGYFPGLMSDELLTETSPVQKRVITIRIPTDKELHYKVFNLRTAPEIEETKNYKVYTFTFSGIAENSHESHQLMQDKHLPRLIFSTLTWNEALDATYAQMMPQPKSSKKMQDYTNELREQNKYDLPFILKLNKAIAENMNSYGVSPYYNGYRSRNPIETWESNGGTAFEKSFLMATMLKEAGVNADPVLVVPTQFFDPEVGCLPLISEVLVQVNPRELEQMYLSANRSPEQNLVFKMNGNTLITLRPDKPSMEAISASFENKVITNGTLILDDSLKCSGNIEILLTETMNPYYKLELDSAVVKGLLSGFSGKDVHESKIINNAQFRSLCNLKVIAQKPLKQQANYFFFDVPENKQGFASWHINYLNANRQTAYQLPNMINEQYSYEISLPENTRLVNPVDYTEMKTSFGEIILSTEQKGDKVIVKRMLMLNQTEIPAESYSDFKKMVDLWNEENFKKVLLSR